MQAEETVVFKLDVSDKGVRRRVMEVVWMFSVTFADVNQKGILKTRGNFNKESMGIKLQKIDKTVAILDPTQLPNRSDIPKPKNMGVFKFEVLDERILQKANKAIWKFPGVTSVEVKEKDQLEVMGEFNNVEMSSKLRKVDKYVSLTEIGPEVEEQKPPHKMFKGMSSFAGSSSRVPTHDERLIKNTSTFIGTGARAPLRAAAPKANAYTPVNQPGAFVERNHGRNNQIARAPERLAAPKVNQPGAFVAQNDGWNNQIARRGGPYWIQESDNIRVVNKDDKKVLAAWIPGSGKTHAITQGSKSYSSFVPSSSSIEGNPYSSTQSSSMGNHSQSSQLTTTSGFTKSTTTSGFTQPPLSSSFAKNKRKGKSNL
ncbi:unnamed protein product [Thlaspi arvense]|uniref:Uncharacterized protein n=1 Tax=Thlaspi arvense TaxID=13288 RepID=A0AAU9SNQ1_THLAR|nr:unnamed protein product [Thlaspi arvense]